MMKTTEARKTEITQASPLNVNATSEPKLRVLYWGLPTVPYFLHRFLKQHRSAVRTAWLINQSVMSMDIIYTSLLVCALILKSIFLYCASARFVRRCIEQWSIKGLKQMNKPLLALRTTVTQNVNHPESPAISLYVWVNTRLSRTGLNASPEKFMIYERSTITASLWPGIRSCSWDRVRALARKMRNRRVKHCGRWKGPEHSVGASKSGLACGSFFVEVICVSRS